MNEARHIVHTIDPVYDSRSRVLILGTLPSPQSRQAAFYYGHRQNRFWAILGALFDRPDLPGAPGVGETAESSRARKIQFLLDHRIALWDVIAECDIAGASDSSIRNPVPNDFSKIFELAAIRAVFTTGKTAYALYRRFCAAKYPAPFFYLPSTSPANCALSPERMAGAYRELLLRFLT
jgi:hypoxanthine-DNA glycosylase